jgi:hypothetical protein
MSLGRSSERHQFPGVLSLPPVTVSCAWTAVTGPKFRNFTATPTRQTRALDLGPDYLTEVENQAPIHDSTARPSMTTPCFV